MTDDRFYRTTFLVNMADSSDKDAAAAVFVMLHTSWKHKKRKIRVRPWIMKRYFCFSLHSGIILLLILIHNDLLNVKIRSLGKISMK